MLYRYQAANTDSALVEGNFEAATSADVVTYLENRKLFPISIKELRTVSGAHILSHAVFERITPLDRILLFRNLATILHAGLSLLEAMEILIADTKKQVVRNILLQAKMNIEAGQPLSFTFMAYTKFFPPLFIGMLKAGETSGKLDSTLEEMANYLMREYSLLKKVKSALAYPALLAIASIGVIILLLVFVLPRLSKVFAHSGVQLPFITRVLVAISQLITTHPIVNVAIVGSLIVFFAYFRKTAPGRRFFSTLAFHLPLLKNLVKKIALVRFSRTLGSLIGSGISILDALQLSADSIGNVRYKEAVLDAKEQIKNGVLFSRTFEKYPLLFPRFFTGLIMVGEKTGTLDHILKTFANFYDEEVDQTLKDLTTFIEPLMLLIMGVFIAGIALSILLPIYRLVGSLG